MPFVPFVDTVEVDVNYTYNGNRVQNTQYFTNSGGVDVPAMASLGEALIDSLVTDIMPNMPNTLTLREITVTDLTSDSAPSITVTTGLPVTGAVDFDPAVPGNVTLTASFRTEGRGRSSRGRNYLLGIRKSQVAQNLVADSFVAIWDAYYNGLLGGSDIAPWVWVVASRIHNGTPRVTGLSQPVTSWLVVDLAVDSQRRRLNGRGS